VLLPRAIQIAGELFGAKILIDFNNDVRRLIAKRDRIFFSM
jgi:hypothetical protein